MATPRPCSVVGQGCKQQEESHPWRSMTGGSVPANPQARERSRFRCRLRARGTRRRGSATRRGDGGAGAASPGRGRHRAGLEPVDGPPSSPSSSMVAFSSASRLRSSAFVLGPRVRIRHPANSTSPPPLLQRSCAGGISRRCVDVCDCRAGRRWRTHGLPPNRWRPRVRRRAAPGKSVPSVATEADTLEDDLAPSRSPAPRSANPFEHDSRTGGVAGADVPRGSTGARPGRVGAARRSTGAARRLESPAGRHVLKPEPSPRTSSSRVLTSAIRLFMLAVRDHEGHTGRRPQPSLAPDAAARHRARAASGTRAVLEPGDRARCQRLPA